MVGDAVELTVTDGRLVGWKPVLGGRVVAAVRTVSTTQVVTVRPGVLPTSRPRPAKRIDRRRLPLPARSRVLSRGRDDEVERLAGAEVVVGVGRGVSPEHYGELRALCRVLGAELGATRKVTDNSWLPRARQIGITGRAVGPRLYIAVGLSGRDNHLLGVRRAGTILAINSDPGAPVFDSCDIGLVGDWREIVSALHEAFEADRTPPQVAG